MTDLQDWGLRPGELVRFRRGEGRRWHEGKVARVARDGSVTLHDRDGAARSLRPELLQVRRPGRGGRPVWQPLVVVRWEQLSLW